MTGDDVEGYLNPSRAGARLDSEKTEPDVVADSEGLDSNSTDESVIPLSEFDPLPSAFGRRRIGRIAPAAMLLPLALLSLLVYFWKSGRLQQPTSHVQIEPTAAFVGIEPQPSRSTHAVSTPSPASITIQEYNDLLAEARELTWQSKFEEAIAVYQTLIHHSREDHRPQIGWALVLLLNGQPDQALTHAQLALALDPTNAEAATILARAYTGLGDKVLSLATAKAALSLEPHNADARAALAEAYLLNGQFDAAIEQADLALLDAPRSAEVHRVRAILSKTVENDPVGAIHGLGVAADLQPGLWLRHYELGQALLEAKDYEQAITAFTEAWVLRRTLLTYSALGQAYYRAGEYDQAASYLEQAISANAWNADTYALLADISALRSRCADAMSYAKQALTQDPNSPLALRAHKTCEASGVAHSLTPTPAAGVQDHSEPPASTPAITGQIVFPVWNLETSRYDTYLARVDGSDYRLLIEGMHQPAFSPDGQWVAVNGDRQDHLNLFIVKPDGSDLREITEHVEDELPAWSPFPLDGSNAGSGLAFSSTHHGDRQSRIYIVNSLAFDGNKGQPRSLHASSDDLRGHSPAWGLDSEGQAQIVYSGCHYYDVSAQCGLILVSSQPGPQMPQPLTNYAQDTAPSVYGSQIAFMSNREGNWELYLINSNGSGLTRLTHNNADDGLPTWAPDGKTIGFVSNQDGSWAVWAVQPDGSDRRKLFDIQYPGLTSEWQNQRIDWGP